MPYAVVPKSARSANVSRSTTSLKSRIMALHIPPDLRNLIEAIEAWPATVSQAQRAALKGSSGMSHFSAGTAAAAFSSNAPAGAGDAAAEDDDEEDEDEAEFLAANPKAAPPPQQLFLSSALRAPKKHKLSSMASEVPQRYESWRFSALSPTVGPGSYNAGVEAMAVHDARRPQSVFKSGSQARPTLVGAFGEPPPPDSRYTDNSMPRKSYGKVLGASPFISQQHRFGHQAHLTNRLREQRPSRRAQQMPRWDAPLHQQPEEPLYVHPFHAERLAAARAQLE